MPPTLEEIVVSPDGPFAEQLGPDFSHSFFNRSPCRHKLGTRCRRCSAGLRKGLAVDLAVRRQGQSVQKRERRRYHVLGNRPSEPPSQLRRDT